MEFDPAAWFARSPVARLATASTDGVPHLVPVVFAVDSGVIYTAVDAKPKRTQRLRRLRNIAANPAASLLVDQYDADWGQLWWARADGTADIFRDGEPLDTGYRLLRAKYPQYQSVSLNGPVIAITVNRWSGWHA